MTLNHGYAYREIIREAGDALGHLLRKYRHSSAAVWRERFGRGELELDGLPIAAEAALVPGQELVWNRPPWDEPEADTRIAILHEDAALLAVVKPSGLPTLPGGGFLENTLLARVRALRPESSPMHRLGRGTSGLVLFSRTRAAGAVPAKGIMGATPELKAVALSPIDAKIAVG